jgi:hypothetical protein
VNAVGQASAMPTTLSVMGCTFTGNEVTGPNIQTGGGAIATVNVSPQVGNSSFTGNHTPNASGDGGAIFSQFDWNLPSQPIIMNLNVYQDTFTSNSASIGGAVYVAGNMNSGTVNVSVVYDTSFHDGAGSGWGGGLSDNITTSGTASASTYLINDTFFSDVAATGAGIGLILQDTGTGTNTALVQSCTVTGCTASTKGGGLWADAGTNWVTVDNNIFDGNTVTEEGYNGPLDDTLAAGTSLTDKGYNLVDASDAKPNGFNNNPNTDVINNGPPGLAATLANNGAKPGYPQTLALLNTSPGYQKGDANLAGTLDERGLTRQNNPGMNLKVSIGAEDPNAM